MSDNGQSTGRASQTTLKRSPHKQRLWNAKRVVVTLLIVATIVGVISAAF